jgi:3-oxoacyl-[acyl-carrier protein] reductase
VAVVTGANGGIGRAIVTAFVGEGTAVVALDVAESVAELRMLGTTDAPVQPVTADVRDATRWRATIAEADARFGPVEVLVNNAGIMHKKPFDQHTIEDWDVEFDVNVRAAFVSCLELLPRMAERGHGVVVNLASIWGSRGGPDRAAYIAAKHAVVGLSRALAADYLPHGIRVNSVSPGPVRTPMTAALGGDQSNWMEPREVAEVIVFLCSSAAGGVTGTNVEIPGRGRPAGL